MLIQAKRIRNLDRYLGQVPEGMALVVGLTNPDQHASRLREIGFSSLEVGEQVLPVPVGPVSRFNAEGKDEVHRDQPLETAYRQIEWEWEEWHGPYTETRSDFRYVPYERYPRTFIPPPSVELFLGLVGDQPAVITSAVAYTGTNRADLLHRINLFLELLGQCEILTEDKLPVELPELRRLNWTVLPPGKRPWEQLRVELEPVVRQVTKGNQAVVQHRLQIICDYEPAFTAVGQAGFRGYVIFGFEERNLFVLESLYYGNATYILGENWEDLSRRTKAELIAGTLHEDRIIHDTDWESKLRDWLEGRGGPRVDASS